MKTKLFNFTKWWLTGFTQADGGFVVNFDAPIFYLINFKLNKKLNKGIYLIILVLHSY